MQRVWHATGIHREQESAGHAADRHVGGPLLEILAEEARDQEPGEGKKRDQCVFEHRNSSLKSLMSLMSLKSLKSPLSRSHITLQTLDTLDSMDQRSSPFHDIELIHVHGPAVPDQEDDDRQGHGGLGGRHGNHEHGEDLAGEVLQIVREGHEVDVRGIEHEFDGHEDDEDVPPRQHAHHADGEERRAQYDVPGKRDHETSITFGEPEYRSQESGEMQKCCEFRFSSGSRSEEHTSELQSPTNLV